MSTRPAAAAALALVVALAPHAAAGHDLWLEPARFEPAPGELVAVGLRVGEPFPGEPVARDPRRIVRFAALGPGGESPLAGRDGADPAAWLRPEAPGRYTLVYRSSPVPITLDAERFEAYLADEGLDGVLAARAARGDSAEPGREQFSRCAKALLRVGGDAAYRAGVARPDGGGFERPLGLRLELLAEADPYALAGGGELPVRLLFESEPLAGALIEAYGPDGRHRAARSDADGRVAFDLDVPGRWLVTAIHMVAAPEGSGADWESVWASLAFALPEG